MEGLSIGVSAYAGTPSAVEGAEPAEEIDPSWGDHRIFGMQLEYSTEKTLLRFEYVTGQKIAHIDAAYIELARRVHGPWQIAGRYETITLDPDDQVSPVAVSLLDHDEWVIGLNYWLNPAAVIKLAYHEIDGNLLVHPDLDEITEIVQAEGLETDSRLISLGVQFSF